MRRTSARIIVVTGAGGFIGRNLVLRLTELSKFEIRQVHKTTTPAQLVESLKDCDVVFHLAGVNRPPDDSEFVKGNLGSTQSLVEAIRSSGVMPRIVYASSAKSIDETPYGVSKKAAEDCLLDLAQTNNLKLAIFRLPNVFGKWCRPNYNSAVATFCFNIARGMPIEIRDASAILTLSYIDDVIDDWLNWIEEPNPQTGFVESSKIYNTTVGEVAAQIQRFAELRKQGRIGLVGDGLQRALYATFVSALPASEFAYPLTVHTDARGSFSEFIKTENSGQVSFFTALPGITRGGHYHHTKSEKFLVVEGQARFEFRSLETGERIEIKASSDAFTVVETIPGWAHNITNIGHTTLIALLWANEVFDPSHPDTIAAKV
ncbi:MAG: NAD-dependent epimerase/dehydratase family protein [Aestuariivirga sp.]